MYKAVTLPTCAVPLVYNSGVQYNTKDTLVLRILVITLAVRGGSRGGFWGLKPPFVFGLYFAYRYVEDYNELWSFIYMITDNTLKHWVEILSRAVTKLLHQYV